MVLNQKTALDSVWVTFLRFVRAALKPLSCRVPANAEKMASIPTIPYSPGDRSLPRKIPITRPNT